MQQLAKHAVILSHNPLVLPPKASAHRHTTRSSSSRRLDSTDRPTLPGGPTCAGMCVRVSTRRSSATGATVRTGDRAARRRSSRCVSLDRPSSAVHELTRLPCSALPCRFCDFGIDPLPSFDASNLCLAQQDAPCGPTDSTLSTPRRATRPYSARCRARPAPSFIVSTTCFAPSTAPFTCCPSSSRRAAPFRSHSPPPRLVPTAGLSRHRRRLSASPTQQISSPPREMQGATRASAFSSL